MQIGQISKKIKIFFILILSIITLGLIIVYNLKFIFDINFIGIGLFGLFIGVISFIFLFYSKKVRYVLLLTYLLFPVWIGYIIHSLSSLGINDDNLTISTDFPLGDIFKLILLLGIIVYYIWLGVDIIKYLYTCKNNPSIGKINNYKSVLYSYISFLGVLGVFYFGYYNNPVNIPQVPDSVFSNPVGDKKSQGIHTLLGQNEVIDDYKTVFRNFYTCILNDEYNKESSIKYNIDQTINNTSSKNIIYCGTKSHEYVLKQRKILEQEYNEKRKNVDKDTSQKYLEEWKQKSKEVGLISRQEYKDNLIFDINIVRFLDKISEEIKTINNGEQLYLHIDTESNENGEILQLIRIQLYSVLYHLENNNEKIAVESLIETYKIGVKILESDGGALEKVYGKSILHTGLKNIQYVIDNYKLSSSNKMKLHILLKKKLPIQAAYKNAAIFSYINNQQELDIITKENIFINKLDMNNYYKYLYQKIINGEKIEDKIEEKYKQLLKRNIIGYKMVYNSAKVFNHMYLENIEIHQKWVKDRILK